MGQEEEYAALCNRLTMLANRRDQLKAEVAAVDNEIRQLETKKSNLGIKILEAIAEAGR